jgi:hypothetical protein
MPLINRVVVQAETTQTAPFNGPAIDISTVPNNSWTLVLEARSSTADSARFCVQDSVDAFTTVVAGPSVEVNGANTLRNTRRWSFTQRDFPDMRFGTASAVLRLALLKLSGTSPSVQYRAWVEY